MEEEGRGRMEEGSREEEEGSREEKEASKNESKKSGWERKRIIHVLQRNKVTQAVRPVCRVTRKPQDTSSLRP